MSETATGRRWPRIALGAAAAVLLLLLGYAVGMLQPRLTAPGDSSAEAGFARDMSTHHAQAIEMGMIAFQKATRPEVRQMGRDIALTQQDQVGRMETWLQDWHLQPTGDDAPMAWMPEAKAGQHHSMAGGMSVGEDGLMPGMATPAELEKLRNATGTDVDILFCQYMLRHHLAGIHMAEAVLQTTKQEQVKELAQSMVAGQNKEVTELRRMLDDLGAKPLS